MIQISEKSAYRWIAGISLTVFALIAWLTYIRNPGIVPTWAYSLPACNAIFNFSGLICLGVGFVAIHRGRREIHQRFMLASLAFAVAFLLSYTAYHLFAGDTHFLGQGWIRTLYFSILISHIFLSAIVFPLALFVVFFSLTSRFEKHKKLARIVFPLWVYVCVTGVLVYFFLRPYYPA